MASIRQLKSGKWNVQIRQAGKKAVSRTFTSQMEVETWAEMAYRYCDQVLVGLPSCHSSRALSKRLDPDPRTHKSYNRLNVIEIYTHDFIELLA